VRCFFVLTATLQTSLLLSRSPFPIRLSIIICWITRWVGHHLSPLQLLLSILLTGYRPQFALTSFGTLKLPQLMERTWLACQPVGDWDDLSVESPHAHRILCSFADAMAHGCLGWSAAHSLLHLLPELSWFLDNSYDKFNIHHPSSLWSCCLPILGNQCAFLYCLLSLSNYLSSVLYNLRQYNGCN